MDRMRPSYHITAPRGWLNDPCGLGYDPATGLYHLSFQWNPKGNDWGNISWGRCVSTNLLTWKISPEPCLEPTTEYDRCGVFTGCLQPTAVNGAPNALTVVYTSVGRLPIHYTLPYVPGSESVSLATSQDRGNTWQRLDCNPVLPRPPATVTVTGWRDPFIGRWQLMLERPGADQSSALCGFLSGGIAGKTPTAFAYAINPHDLRHWTYLGPLVQVGLNFQPSRWSGDLGVNWEVVNWVPMTDDESTTRYFIIMGAEGCVVSGKDGKRIPRAQLWMSVKPCSRAQPHSATDALSTYAYSGIFDHGCCYAANSFWDPITTQHIVYCWITEEDLPDDLRHQQGWSGMLSIPRVATLTTLHCVRRARRSELSAITSIETQRETEHTSTVRTLGIRPDPRLEGLRNEGNRIRVDNVPLAKRGDRTSPSDTYLSLMTSRWEVHVEFSVSNQCSAVGIEIQHDGNAQHHTILSWEPFSEVFTIQRPPPHDSRINHDPESAPHTLFTFETLSGEQREETLRIHAFWDASVLEVFVNERTVISTRIYLLPNQVRCSRLRFFAEGETDSPPAMLLQADGWDGLGVSQ